MKRTIAFFLILLVPQFARALNPNEWRFSQALDVSTKGLVRVDVSPETLNSARSNLEDLRIVDPTGQEVAYLVDPGTPQRGTELRPRELRTELRASVTRLILVTGTKEPLNALAFEAPPQTEFVKAVALEGSHNGRKWQELTSGQPIFKKSAGVENLRVSFPDGSWEFLRVTIDDSRTPAVPFTGVQLCTAETTTPPESLTTRVTSRDEGLGVTRLALDLGAANLTVAALKIETPDSLFTRTVTIALPELANDNIREHSVRSESIYRIDINGTTESRLEIPVDAQVRGRQLILLIQNGDSPPLAIANVRCDRRVPHLVFLARESGRYQLLSGNNQCAAPQYDLSGLSDQLKTVTASETRTAAIISNAAYKPGNDLAAISLAGAKIDIADWKYRRLIQLAKSDAQQIELDPEILAHAAADERDLRIVSQDRQFPFLIERTSISRAVPLDSAAANDPKNPTLSRWSLKLPIAGVPIKRITCAAGTDLFQREMRLWENIADERGDTFPHDLGRVIWRRVPNQKTAELEIDLDAVPESDSLFLESNNGDNPPIELRNFRGYYPVVRTIFKTPTDSSQPISIYYGNRDVTAPRYDVALIADQLLRAERGEATLGPAGKTDSNATRLGQTLTGSARYIFWSVLALVVVALLLLIARLLPKAETEGQ
jgi:Protein of unknown function (DUF3999)